MNIELLNVAKINDSGTSGYQAGSKSRSSAVSEYAKILAAKMATARDDMREMNYIQSQLDEIRELQEEITGKIQDSDTSGNAAAGKSSGKGAIDTITKFRADGSVVVMKVRDGDVVNQVKFKPDYVPVPDYTAPPTPSGEVQMKIEARPSSDWLMFLMG